VCYGQVENPNTGRFPSNVIGEVEDYQKYFYCPKVSRKERHQGVDNNHPTVKPVALMRYLIKLVTPPNSIVLDPFSGSGSTGMAAVELGHEFIGCELDPAYVDIANCRIETWNDSGLPKDLFDV
jgi:site-specific DNA-methyltransferase (adenine-specific)